MRHRYATKAIALKRYPLSEASAGIVLLTDELGLVHARAQSVRKQGAKLACALQTFTESDVILLRGKESWRISGAVLDTSWFSLLGVAERERAGRVAGFLLRLAPCESIDSRFFHIMRDFFQALVDMPENLHDSAECLVSLRFLRILGLDAGELPVVNNDNVVQVLETIEKNRGVYIARINHGITASGL
ncbi:hypothetical protein MNBD_CPR01-511 [hydrothermal vent metagenome]|uniref:DNA replication/recombination mediator RecO N-terminal domain-containing protein n=1 Tax=hydrothermal vent metagenome TaxID=652676 RepID=A0A3B0VM48_9ZZZZ